MFFLPRCSTCAFTPFFPVVLSLFFFFHEVSLPTHSSFSLPFSLSPALHLTQRQHCSQNATLPLQALPVTCSPLNPCSPEKAGGRFGFPFPSRGQSLLDYFHTQKHTPRRGAKGVCVFSGQPTWPLTWPWHVTTLWCMCHFFYASDLGAHASVTRAHQTHTHTPVFSCCASQKNKEKKKPHDWSFLSTKYTPSSKFVVWWSLCYMCGLGLQLTSIFMLV